MSDDMIKQALWGAALGGALVAFGLPLLGVVSKAKGMRWALWGAAAGAGAGALRSKQQSGGFALRGEF